MADLKKNFIFHGSILAFAGILVRIIGMLYRIPMVNIIGSEGNGIYSVAFNVYNIMLILSSYGLPMAVSKLVAAKIATKEYANAKMIFTSALGFSLITGGIAGLFIYFGADFLEATVYTGYEGIALPLKVLAPTIFVVAVLGVFRGFFQGLGSMIPTAVSQIVEQVFNAVVSIVAASILVKSFADSPVVAGYGAAGGTMGTAAGALIALIILMVLFILYLPFFNRTVTRHGSRVTMDRAGVFKMIACTVAPIILSQTLYQISAMIDDVMFGNIMTGLGKSTAQIKTDIGNFGSSYNILISIPMGVASAMSASMLPSIVGSYSRGEKKEIRRKIASSVKANMFIVIPSFVGLFVLGEPIVKLLFPSYDAGVGGMMLRIGGISTVFYTLSTVTSSALQGIDRMKVPVMHAGISLVLHIVITYGLLKFTPLGIYGVVIGNATFPILIFVLNFVSLRKYIRYRQEYLKTFGVTGLCAVIMGICSRLTYDGLYVLSASNTASLVLAVIAAVVIYFGLMILLKKKK